LSHYRDAQSGDAVHFGSLVWFSVGQNFNTVLSITFLPLQLEFYFVHVYALKSSETKIVLEMHDEFVLRLVIRN